MQSLNFSHALLVVFPNKYLPTAGPWGWVRQLAARRQSFVVGRRCRRRHLHRPSRWERRDAPLIWSCRKEVVADTKWGHTTPSHNILYLGSLFGDGRINLIALSSMPNGSLVRRCAAPTMTTFLSTQGQQELMTLLMPPPCMGLMQGGTSMYTRQSTQSVWHLAF